MRIATGVLSLFSGVCLLMFLFVSGNWRDPRRAERSELAFVLDVAGSVLMCVCFGLSRLLEELRYVSAAGVPEAAAVVFFYTILTLTAWYLVEYARSYAPGQSLRPVAVVGGLSAVALALWLYLLFQFQGELEPRTWIYWLAQLPGAAALLELLCGGTLTVTALPAGGTRAAVLVPFDSE